MDDADRMAFEDARREANLPYTVTERRNAWFGTAVGLLLGAVALAWLFVMEA